MKIRNILLTLITLIFFTGCYTGPKTYDVFKRLNDGITNRKMSFKSYKEHWIQYYTKKEYNQTMNIYIRNNNKRDNTPTECVYGFLTHKNDPEQITLGWVVISGKEFCQARQPSVLIQ